MVLQYQNELLALAAIFLLILIYLGIKQKNKAETDTKAAKKEEALKAEQSGQSTATPQKKIQEKKIQHSVPKHAKITKEDFKIFAGERILLAEDNLINQKVILGVLGDSGIEVVVANDGQEALDLLKTDKNFLIILMDAHMPRVDGFEATRAIRHDPQNNHIPVIALSGDTASDDIRKMKEAGMDEHLEKPLQVGALYDILYHYSSRISSAEENPSDLPTLDTHRGLQVCGNDSDFYHDILKEFLVAYSNSAEELEILFKNNKADQADSLLLDIIGVSANIGADALTACANDIKNKIAKNESSDLTLYKKRVQELIQSIENYFLTCK